MAIKFQLTNHIASMLVLASITSFLAACDGLTTQLCGRYACLTVDDTNRGSSNASPRQCESASSIRDRAPAILNQLRQSQRSCAGLVQANATLVWDAGLADASVTHTRDMARFNFDSFTGSDGSSSADRVERAGVVATQLAESIGRGPQTSAEMINTWLDIPTDCRQLLNPQFTRVGMACSVGQQSQNGPFWSLLLATPN